jgi:periplasmic divalent cation tolerance protein
MTEKANTAMLANILRTPPKISSKPAQTMNTETVMLYCTCPDEETARLIATQIVERGLAGCVNRVPGLTSVYKWHGELKTGTEVLLLIKTAADRTEALIAALLSMHPYELPEIIVVPITGGHQPYLDWIRNCTR